MLYHRIASHPAWRQARVSRIPTGGDRMMQVEALQWLDCIFTRRLRADCHQLYELGNAKTKCMAPGARVAHPDAVAEGADEALSTMKETQTQRPVLSEKENHI